MFCEKKGNIKKGVILIMGAINHAPYLRSFQKGNIYIALHWKKSIPVPRGNFKWLPNPIELDSNLALHTTSPLPWASHNLSVYRATFYRYSSKEKCNGDGGGGGGV